MQQWPKLITFHAAQFYSPLSFAMSWCFRGPLFFLIWLHRPFPIFAAIFPCHCVLCGLFRWFGFLTHLTSLVGELAVGTSENDKWKLCYISIKRMLLSEAYDKEKKILYLCEYSDIALDMH